MDAVQVVPGEEDVVGVNPAARSLQLEQHDFEPELVDLVGDDEQQLVVLLAEPLLQPQQLRHLEVAAVGKLAPFLAESTAQCLKWRRPVMTIAIPASSAAAITSASLTEPPG